MLVASFSAVEFGQLFYRYIERAKTGAVVHSRYDYDASMIITKEIKIELDWWISNFSTAVRRIVHEPYEIITSDASDIGWGAVMNDLKSGGRWTIEEARNHINYLELLACFFGLKSFCSAVTKKNVRLFMDNTSAYHTSITRGEGGGYYFNKMWQTCIRNLVLVYEKGLVVKYLAYTW